MNKLELKHLAPYLPYGLYGQVEDFEENTTHVNVKLQSIGIDDLVLSFDQCVDVYLDEPKDSIFKPILRPLSDLKNGFLKKEFEEYCGSEMNLSRFSDVWHSISRKRFIHRLPYHIIEWLLEHHFDVFGLIEKGLAIDINTLKDE